MMGSILLDKCLEAQTAIIGSMLIDAGCIGEVLTAVSEDDFPSGGHRTVFSTIKALFSAGTPVDPVIVAGKLDEAYRQFLMQCMEVTPTAAHAGEYCKILRENARLLQLQDLGEQLRTVSDLDTARGLAEKVNRLMVERSGLQIFSAKDLALNFYKRMSNEKKPEYIKTGFSGLDRKLFIEPGDMVGIGAAPSTGKTAFALQWATNLARKYRVGFYSLETGPEKITDRVIARTADVSLQDIKVRTFDQDAWVRLGRACSDFSDVAFELIHASGMTASDIMATAISRRQQIIFIDYLQLVASGSRSNHSALEVVTESSITFHRAAQQNSITVVVLSQLSRPRKEDGKPVPPDMHSFRESGQIEQDLDVALLMYLSNPDDYKSDRRIKIGKNKEGEKGQIDISFDGVMQRFGPAPKARRDAAQMRMEEDYAAAESAGKAFEEVDAPVPF